MSSHQGKDQGKESSGSHDEQEFMSKGKKGMKRKSKNDKVINVVILSDWKQIV